MIKINPEVKADSQRGDFTTYRISDFIRAHNVDLNSPLEMISSMDYMGLLSAALMLSGRREPLDFYEIVCHTWSLAVDHDAPKFSEYPEWLKRDRVNQRPSGLSLRDKYLNKSLAAFFIGKKPDQDIPPGMYREKQRPLSIANNWHYYLPADLIAALKRVIYNGGHPSDGATVKHEPKITWDKTQGVPTSISQFYESATYAHSLKNPPIAVKPVLIPTEEEDNGSKHYEWLLLCGSYYGYVVAFRESNGRRYDQQEFITFEEALDYFNNWKP